MPLAIDDANLEIAAVFYRWRTAPDLPTFKQLWAEIIALGEDESTAADLAAQILSGLKQDKEKIK